MAIATLLLRRRFASLFATRFLGALNDNLFKNALLVWALIHSVCRVEREALDNIPTQGAALLVCNHVSFVDALLIAAVSPRPVRFVMDHRIFPTPMLNAVFRAMRGLPRRLWSRLAVVSGAPVPAAQVSAAGLQRTVAELRGEWR